MATRRLEQIAPGAGISAAGIPAASTSGAKPSPESRVTGAGAEGVAAADAPVSSSSFERAIQRLGEIVESLEDGEQPLEESIALFEEGMALARSSQEILDRAERRIEELLAVDSQGKPVVRELEAD